MHHPVIRILGVVLLLALAFVIVGKTIIYVDDRSRCVFRANTSTPTEYYRAVDECNRLARWW